MINSCVLHLKYRPKKWADVVGQDRVVKSLQAVIAKDASHCFLFSGGSGCGKTTLARIAAQQVGCNEHDITEIDAATYNGVDDMRDVASGLRYKPFNSKAKAVIIDEAHAVSKAGFDSLLKILEEPPAHVYWFLCTTNIGKIPAAIKTRCLAYDLVPVSAEELLELLAGVVQAEKLKVPEEVLSVAVNEAKGSPRQALVNLAVVAACKNRAEAAPLLQAALETPAVRDLCQALVKGATFDQLRAIVAGIGDEIGAEGVRIQVALYIAAVLKRTGSARLIKVLDAFSNPCNPSDKMAPIYLAIGRVCFSE